MAVRNDAGTAGTPRRGRTGAGGQERVEIDRVAVRSTHLESVGYDGKSRILEIEFRDGRVYRYSEVPPGEHSALMAAPSRGKYFAAHVRDRYGCTRVS